MKYSRSTEDLAQWLCGSVRAPVSWMSTARLTVLMNQLGCSKQQRIPMDFSGIWATR